MTPLRVGSLFTGYGGLDIAVHDVLADLGALAFPEWVADIEEFDKKGTQVGNAPAILAHRIPHTVNLGDLRDVDWTTSAPPVDILIGGFPCQDVSIAGRRAGMTTTTRSGLWSIFAEAIQALQPRLVVIENVPGLRSAPAHSSMEPCPWCVGDARDVDLRALDAVLADLATLGFDAVWESISAANVGAFHIRDRIFLLAYPQGDPWRIFNGKPPQTPHPGRLHGTTRRLTTPRQEAFTPTHDHPPRCPRTCPPSTTNFGDYDAAIRHWEKVTGLTAPPHTVPHGKHGAYVMNPAFVEFQMGLPPGWVTAPHIGLTRTQQLRALGNGVVPQQANYALHLLFNHILATQESVATP